MRRRDFITLLGGGEHSLRRRRYQELVAGKSLSLRTIQEIDWADRLSHLNVNRQKVKDGPLYDPSITVDGAYDETFLTYYGIRWGAV